MLPYWLDFDSPWYLILLIVVPAVWILSYRSLAGLGPLRRAVAIILRSVMLVLVILAVAETQLVQTSQKLTVIYLLDQSRSIPKEQRRAMVEYAKAEVAKHRDPQRGDRAGVIVFGGDAAIEVPPFDDNLPIFGRIESTVDEDHTNLSAAMKLAQASFPEDAAKRIVIVSDGNENLGQALEQAQGLAQAGIGIDVVPVRYQARAEVAVEKLTIPANVNRLQPFDLRVVLSNTAQAGDQNAGSVKGRLKIVRKTGDQEIVLQDEPVTLEPGKNVFSLREQIDSPDFYTYEARFIPEADAEDDLAENNRATMHTHVRGQGQVLLIQDAESGVAEEHKFLSDRLRTKNLEVSVQSSSQLFTTLAELQPFDTVILANVPREHFSDTQIKMLVSNTQQMGAGLIMLGGANSFGAGGWTNTAIEEAMPVDFQIKNAKVEAIGALAMIMHASEMAQGNHWQKIVAQEAIKTLGPQDYCGLIHWGATADEWLWGAKQGGIVKISGNRRQMLAKLDSMTPGDMPAFDPAMKMAAASFASLPKEVAVKHMIIISDGDPGPPSASVINALVQQKVTVTTVAIGTHGPPGSTPLQKIANATGGKYYVVNQASVLPKIYQKEARAISRPLVFEPDFSFQPRLKFRHQITQDVENPLPPITGFVLTQLKASPLTEVLITSPVPEGERNATILATWTYGLGKTAAFTTDSGKRWASQWTGWSDYDKLFTNLVRWSMRPPGDQGKFSVVSDVKDGKVRVVVTALDKDDQFLNFLDMAGSVVSPDMKPLDIKIEQTAPGRYVGEFDAKEAGSYFLMLNPGAGMTAIRTGINVPYSAEFLDRETDEALLKSLASLVPADGVSGVIIEDASGRGDLETLLEINTFRHDLAKARSTDDIWPWLAWIGGWLLFFDVFTRRVAVSFGWLAPLTARIRDRVLQREPAPVASEYMDRLRSRKAAVSQSLEQRRAAARFEPSADELVEADAILSELAPPPAKPKPAKPAEKLSADKKEEDDYTSRLLKAKKKVWEERDQK